MLSPYLIENRHVAVKRCKHSLFMYNRNDAFVGRGLELPPDSDSQRTGPRAVR